MQTVEQDIEMALTEAAPIDSIREIAIRLNLAGVKKSEILQELYAYTHKLRSLDRDTEINYIEDVIDMITGYYAGRDLDLK